MNPLIERFVSCAICCGYCIDSGRAQLFDEIGPDLCRFRDKILAVGVAGVASLRELLAPDNSHWVRYFASEALIQELPDDAISTLKELQKIDGLVALSSEVALSFHAKKLLDRKRAARSDESP